MVYCFQWRQMKLYSLWTAPFPRNISVDHLLRCPVAETFFFFFFTTYKFLFSIFEVLRLKPDIIILLNMPKECELLQAWLWALRFMTKPEMQAKNIWTWAENNPLYGESSSHCGWNQITSVYTKHIVVTNCLHLLISVKNQKMGLNIISEGTLLSQWPFVSFPPQLSACLKPEKNSCSYNWPVIFSPFLSPRRDTAITTVTKRQSSRWLPIPPIRAT